MWIFPFAIFCESMMSHWYDHVIWALKSKVMQIQKLSNLVQFIWYRDNKSNLQLCYRLNQLDFQSWLYHVKREGLISIYQFSNSVKIITTNILMSRYTDWSKETIKYVSNVTRDETNIIEVAIQKTWQEQVVNHTTIQQGISEDDIDKYF